MKKYFTLTILPLLLFSILLFLNCCNRGNAADIKIEAIKAKTESVKNTTVPETSSFIIDTADYNRRILILSNNDDSGRWPVKGAYPLPGAVLPYKRIIAYYGNLYSTRMGILGELPKKAMLKKLEGEVNKWNQADVAFPAIPALHYVAITAQVAPGKENKYRMRMPFHQIDTIISWAKEIDALVFLDIQVGHSTVTVEASSLEKYFVLPQVHLGIDPEFSMKNGERPGTKIGTFTADDINSVVAYLADIVRKNNLPPKVLVIHRFTQRMLTDYKRIKIVPEVQIVIDMDGFGSKVLKKSTYVAYIYREPIQFAGFKLFYKNDTKNNPNGLYTPEEILKLKPNPIYIQYQ
ncbi:hypothetical protein [Flavobacterium sp. K5-23]|uniref:hypothetical protein n=1 Tax=Flavobacterium sp. K5-23 TaxID=2746225 RepID=UPI00200EFFCB|nr:hypothetical protein [Flavobacterium sp. K5-23]UQD55530.1 hypothetical protein FLAK523_03625 [Flavobacterium sp. K5-23]